MSRKDFGSLDQETKNRIAMMDDAVSSFKELLSLFPGRESAIAVTHMETAAMWANKAFTNK